MSAPEQASVAQSILHGPSLQFTARSLHPSDPSHATEHAYESGQLIVASLQASTPEQMTWHA
jgi:hypothetical protein